MPRIWRYVLAHDSGRAPCLDNRMLTLCCCKPRIRANARVGDWVVGFTPKRQGVGLVAWAGRVSDVIPMGAYGEQHPERQDAIYRTRALGGDGRELLCHIGGDYHNTPKAISTDASGVNSLLFSPFWYFGENARALPEHLLCLTHYFIGQTTRGSSPELAAALENWLRQRPAGVWGRPRNLESNEGRGLNPISG